VTLLGQDDANGNTGGLILFNGRLGEPRDINLESRLTDSGLVRKDARDPHPPDCDFNAVHTNIRTSGT
jgi:hypothetical protein